MSYEEEKQDRKIDQLGAEIERLRAENSGLSKAVIDIQEERDLAQAEFRAYHKAWEEQAARIRELESQIARLGRLAFMGDAPPGKIIDHFVWWGDSTFDALQKDKARIRELEDALVEAMAWKLMEEHNEFSSIGGTEVKDLVDFLDEAREQLRAEGKIGPNVKPRFWQITDERKAAIERLIIPVEILLVDHETDSGIKEAVSVLRSMLEAGQ